MFVSFWVTFEGLELIRQKHARDPHPECPSAWLTETSLILLCRSPHIQYLLEIKPLNQRCAVVLTTEPHVKQRLKALCRTLISPPSRSCKHFQNQTCSSFGMNTCTLVSALPYWSNTSGTSKSTLLTQVSEGNVQCKGHMYVPPWWWRWTACSTIGEISKETFSWVFFRNLTNVFLIKLLQYNWVMHKHSPTPVKLHMSRNGSRYDPSANIRLYGGGLKPQRLRSDHKWIFWILRWKSAF